MNLTDLLLVVGVIVIVAIPLVASDLLRHSPLPYEHTERHRGGDARLPRRVWCATNPNNQEDKR